MKAKPPEAQYMRLNCECGARGGAYVHHYDVVQCLCGKWFVALQPRRDGPLVAFPRPELSQLYHRGTETQREKRS